MYMTEEQSWHKRQKNIENSLKATPYNIRPDFPVFIYTTYGLFQQLNLVLVFKAAF